MLGLARGTVRLVPPDAGWPAIFAQERRILCERIGHLVRDIQHVGSTAVPGLDAKPVIDIAVAVTAPRDVARCRAPLVELGYLDRGDTGSDGGYLFVKESAPAGRTHYLHLVTLDDPQWTNDLRFRDRLRADALLRAEYAALKRALQERFAGDLRGYAAAKEAFVRRVLDP
jgi:GrpB-like predicted nucleotidyltransferase (UPF0157 family)